MVSYPIVQVQTPVNLLEQIQLLPTYRTRTQYTYHVPLTDINTVPVHQLPTHTTERILSQIVQTRD